MWQILSETLPHPEKGHHSEILSQSDHTDALSWLNLNHLKILLLLLKILIDPLNFTFSKDGKWCFIDDLRDSLIFFFPQKARKLASLWHQCPSGTVKSEEKRVIQTLQLTVSHPKKDITLTRGNRVVNREKTVTSPAMYKSEMLIPDLGQRMLPIY